jgi:hypothetical protein
MPIECVAHSRFDRADASRAELGFGENERILVSMMYDSRESVVRVPARYLHTGDVRRVIRTAGNLCLRHRLLVRYSTQSG